MKFCHAVVCVERYHRDGIGYLRTLEA